MAKLTSIAPKQFQVYDPWAWLLGTSFAICFFQLYNDVYASVYVNRYVRVLRNGGLGSACGLMKIQHDLSYSMN